MIRSYIKIIPLKLSIMTYKQEKYIRKNHYLSLLSQKHKDILSSDQIGILSQAEKIKHPIDRWRYLQTNLFTYSNSDEKKSRTNISFDIIKELYENNYKNDSIAPVWYPDEHTTTNSNIQNLMNLKNISSYQELYEHSINHPEEFWDTCIRLVNIHFDKPYDKVFNIPTTSQQQGLKDVQYLHNAKFNIISSCFNKRVGTDPAIFYASDLDSYVHSISFNELDKLSNRVANALTRSSSSSQRTQPTAIIVTDGLGLRVGDTVGICMPMSVEAVAAYLGIVKAGFTVISIADSFSAKEIETRLRIAGAKAVLTQDVIYRNDKSLPLFQRVLQAQEHLEHTCSIITVPGNGQEIHSSVQPNLRAGIDFEWHKLLYRTTTATTSSNSISSSTTITTNTTNNSNYFHNNNLNEDEVFEPVLCDPSHVCNILFSSGTTGEPKAIPFTHSTPIKCAVDGYLHQNISKGDVVCWPTNLGWMMGPWLIFQLINGASLALYNGIPSTNQYCKFIENAKVTMLGVVPSLVKTWQTTNAVDNCDWSGIKLFSSTGEASDPSDMLWLMSRAPFKPVIEYCGGTEIAGSYLSSTVLHPNVPSMFTTPVLGSNITVINHENEFINCRSFTLNHLINITSIQLHTGVGEVALIPPSIGLSTKLLNRDHHNCYYDDMPPGPNGELLRRHGDEIEVLEWDESKYLSRNINHLLPIKYFRALGRCDDTMNLGGIKVSSVEIERVCNQVIGVIETAAVAVNPPHGGPSKLVLFVVLANNTNNNTTNNSTINDSKMDSNNIQELKFKLQQAIKESLNPLFHLSDIQIRDKLPRTASNKVMRRVLRDEYVLKLQ